MPARLTLREFEKRYRALLGGKARAKENESCVECEGCTASTCCTFCKSSDRLVRCHFCVSCRECTDSLHCRGSRGLLACQHCVDSEACSKSSYLVRCHSLSGCSYCFGCVGLSGKDFHFLNEPLERKEYFELTRRMLQELGG